MIIAFFYVTFNDNFKQDESIMIQTLFLQLFSQFSNFYTNLARLHKLNRNVVFSSKS